MLTPLTPRLVGAAPTNEELERRLDEQETRLDRVERRSILDRILFSADYRTIFNAFIYRGPSSDPYAIPDPANPLARQGIRETTPEVWSHRFRLKLRAEPISSIRLTARMTFYKIFGDSDSAPLIQDFAASRVPRDTAARFDQIWVDWFATEWLAFSAGRIAYSEGNPHELRENSTVRGATWGLHMVDGEYETINVTANLSRFLEGMYIRGFYASWFNDDDLDAFGSFPFLSDGTKNLRIVGGNMDLVIPGVGRNFVQLGYYVVPKFRPFNIPIPDPGYSAEDDYTHAPAPLNGSLLFPSAKPSSLGSYHNASALVEFYDFFGSGLDWFVSGALGWLNPNGQGISYDLPVGEGGARQSTPFLFLASQGADSGLTTFFYAGLRYSIPVLTIPKVGFEFNYGSRYHISFATPTDQLLTKLAVRGKAYETYLIVPFNPHVFLRGSYLFIDNDYQTGFFGPNPELFPNGTTAPAFDQKIHNFQLILTASF